MSTMAELGIGARARVVTITDPGSVGERLMELGLTPGAIVEVLRRGPAGDPVQLAVRGAMLSVRRAEAASVRIAPLG